MKKIFMGLCVVLLIASTSYANLMLDVTLTNGAKTQIVTAGQSALIPVQLWAVVSGTNGDYNDEGVSYLFVNMICTDVGVTNVSGITTVPIKNAAFNGTGPSGTKNYLDADATYDWGSNSTDPSDLGYCVFNSKDSPDPIYGNNLNGYLPAPVISGTTTRFLLGTYRLRFSAGIGGAGTITLNAQVPTFNSDTSAKAVWFEDNVNYKHVIGSHWDEDSETWITDYNDPFDNTDANYKRIWMVPNQGSTGNEYVGEAVVLTLIPEPSTFILLGMGVLALLAFWRRK